MLKRTQKNSTDVTSFTSGSVVNEEQRTLAKHAGAHLLDGAKMAEDLRARLASKISESRRHIPGLAVILVGADPASKMYVEFKSQASREVGMRITTYELPETISQKRLTKIIHKLNNKKKIHGILVQLPLPKHLDEFEVMQTVDPQKDVDGFHPLNIGWLSIGSPVFLPATVRGIARLIASTKIDLAGKHVVMVGASNIVGKPTAQWFLNEGATVTVCHSRTEDLAVHTKQADVLVTATGVAGLIHGGMVKKGVVVIDAGIARVENTSGEMITVGDCDFAEVAKKASFITPVPGGVGPLTVASLLENTWIAMRRQKGEVESPHQAQ